MDNAARDLGYITYRQSLGTPAVAADVEALTRRIAEAETAAARIEAEIAQVKQRSGGTGPVAGEAGAPTSEAGPAATDTASPASPSEPAPGA
jgi:hypothetical protein